MSSRERDATVFSSLLKSELNTVAVPPSAWLRLAQRITNKAPRRAWRWTLSAALAGAAVLLAAVAAFAVSSLTRHIVIHRVPTALSGPGKALPKGRGLSVDTSGYFHMATHKHALNDAGLTEFKLTQTIVLAIPIAERPIRVPPGAVLRMLKTRCTWVSRSARSMVRNVTRLVYAENPPRRS
jgi:hypothetical protein